MQVGKIDALSIGNGVKMPDVKKIHESFDMSFNAFIKSDNLMDAGSTNISAEAGNSNKNVKEVMPEKSKIQDMIKSSKTPKDAVNSEVVSEVETEIKEIVMEELNISEEELEQILAETGMTLFDLLIPQNLAQFVTEAMADGNPMLLLTDSEISSAFTDVTQQLSTLVDEYANELDIPTAGLVDELLDYAQNNLKQTAVVNTEEVSETSDKAEVKANENLSLEDKVIVTENVNTDSMESGLAGKKQENTANSGSNNNLTAGDSIVQNLVQNVNDSFEGMVTDNVFQGYATEAESIVRQLVDSIKVNISADVTSMELQLTPESLGKLALNISSKEGVITAQITAQTEAAKAAIENQLVVLKENFNNQGLKVEAVEVTIESHAFENGKNFEGSNKENPESETHRKIRDIDLDGFEEAVTEEDILEMDMMRAQGNTVSYMA